MTDTAELRRRLEALLDVTSRDPKACAIRDSATRTCARQLLDALKEEDAAREARNRVPMEEGRDGNKPPPYVDMRRLTSALANYGRLNLVNPQH